MVEYSDIFDEVDEFQKKAKSEEEIQKMCTKDDMNELQRACHLLKKGWEQQKHSIITNLDRYLREPGANEDLLRPIISSLDGFDEKLQQICANAFLPALRKNLVNMENKQRILNISVKIITDDACQNEPLIVAWIEVFQIVIGMVELKYAHMVSYKAIENKIDRKNSIAKRLQGNKLLAALILSFGESFVDEHKEIIRLIQSVCGDTNFIIRLDGVQLLNRYLQQHKKEIISSPRLTQIYLPELYELLHDEEIFIRIEAIEAICHVIDAIDTKTIEKELIPPLLKVLSLSNNDEVELRLSRLFGSIVHSLIKSELHIKYKEQLFGYFKQIVDHQKSEIRLNAIYNLPCINKIYNRKKLKLETPSTATTRDTEEEIKNIDSADDESLENYDFQAQYLSLSQEKDEEHRALVASCLHEGFKLVDNQQDASQIRDAFHELLTDDSKDVLIALTHNLETLIGLYCNQHAINQLIPETQQKVEKIDFSLKTAKNFIQKPFIKKQMTALLPDFDRLQDDEAQEQSQYLILPEYTSELVYSKLLAKLIDSKQILSEKIALWRENVVFLQAIASQATKFHLPELQDRFTDILFEDIRKGNTQLRQAAAQLFANIIANQQDSQRRKALAEQLRNELGDSTAFQMRKTFIFLCCCLIEKIQRSEFEENFFDAFIQLGKDKVPQVRMEFAKSLFQIKPFLEQNKNLLLKINERTKHLNDDKDQDVAEAIADSDYQLLMNKKKIQSKVEESEQRSVMLHKQLQLREKKEEEERKKRQEEEGDRLDYGAYSQTNRTGFMLKKKNTIVKSKNTVTSSKASTKNVAVNVDKNKIKRTSTLVGKNPEIELKPNPMRKASVLLPQTAGLEGKNSSLLIPGLKQLNKDPQVVDSRYQQMIVTSAGGGVNGSVNAVKRSSSLLAESSNATSATNKSRIQKKSIIGGGHDSSHQVTSGQPATKQKNGYQKLKNNVTKAGALSSDDSSSSNEATPTQKNSGTFKTKY